MDTPPPFAIPAAGARLFQGTLDRAKGVSMQRGRRIAITQTLQGPVHLDGEPRSLPATLTIEVVPRSLRVLLPDSVDRV